jgi:hypothetical protein
MVPLDASQDASDVFSRSTFVKYWSCIHDRRNPVFNFSTVIFALTVTYFVPQISSILSPVERKAFGGNSSTRIGASATSAAVNFFAASFLLWRVPFAIMPTLMCFGWDFVYASMLSSNTAIGLQVNQYLDRMPLPYSEADLRKIKEETQKESK